METKTLTWCFHKITFQQAECFFFQDAVFMYTSYVAVHFTGFLTDSKFYTVYLACDVVVLIKSQFEFYLQQKNELVQSISRTS